MTIDIKVISQGNDDFLNLLGEFTGGSEDEGLSLFDTGVNLKRSAFESQDRW